MIYRLTLLVLGLFAADARAGELDWPRFRGPSGDGHAAKSALPTTWSESTNVKWKTAIHGRGWCSPVIWDRQVWLTTATEDGKQMSVLCLDRDTGKVLHDRVLFENEEPRFCHAMNSYASPTCAIEEGRVYVHFGSYGTACLDTSNAEVLWSRTDLPCDHFRGPGSSPLLDGDRLFIHYDGFDFQYIAALDKKTGETIWKKDRNVDYGTDNGDIKKAYCTPLIFTLDGRRQLISPTSKATIAYDPQTGDELWRVRYSGFSATATPLYGNGLLYLNTGFSKAELKAVLPGGEGDVTDSHVKWTLKKGIPSKSSQVLVGDLMYMVHDAGVATCIDAVTGETLYQKRLQGKYSSSLLYAGGHIYMFNHEGQATVLKHGRELEVVAENALDDGCLASPAVSGNALFVRTKTHLYRIEK